MNAAEYEPLPEKGGTEVASLVLQDIKDRVDMGLEKYGTKLETFNGRNALMDAYQELIDLLMYMRQVLEEGTLEDAMRNAGGDDTHVLVRYDPLRTKNQFTILINDTRLTDTDDPLGALK